MGGRRSMLGSGDLDRRVAFDEPTKQSADSFGQRLTGWSERHCAYAHFRFLRGGEVVQAARMRGTQLVVVSIRTDGPYAGAIRSTWRMRDLDTGETYNVKTNPILTDDRRFYELTCESGVAVGATTNPQP